MASYNFTCPSCHKLFTCDDSQCGSTLLCPHCNGQVFVPRLAAPSTGPDAKASSSPSHKRGLAALLYSAAGIIGGLAACVTALHEKFPELYDEILWRVWYPKESVVWYGFLRDVGTNNQSIIRSSETLQLRSNYHRVAGEVMETPTVGATNSDRWTIKGKLYQAGDLMFLQYELRTNSPWGRGFYVLKRCSDDNNVFLGQWVGVHSTLKEVVTFPYALTLYREGEKSPYISHHLQQPGVTNGVMVR